MFTNDAIMHSAKCYNMHVRSVKGDVIMAVLTFSREFGSDGDVIARRVSEALGYKYIDKDIIEEVLVKYGLVAFADLYDSEHGLWGRFDSEKKRIVTMLEKAIKTFARLDNCVIVGRGAFVVLQDYDNVLNISVKAPFEKRVKRIMIAKELDDPMEAAEFVKQHDKIRRSFLQTFYSIKYDEMTWFDMCFDLKLINADSASDWIVKVVKELESRVVSEEHDVKNITEDKIMSSAIEEVMRSV
jgi:cytidylate kinase